MLSNFQLDDICKQHDIKLNFCSFKSDLNNDKHKYKNYNAIINLASGGLGSHWLCLIIKDGNAIYSDPFGVIYPTEVLTFCKARKVKHLAYTTDEIQYINDDHCGYYALALLLFVKHNKGNLYDVVEKYLSMYSKNPKDNANILKSYLAKYNIHF